jgi:hypothetical protein
MSIIKDFIVKSGMVVQGTSATVSAATGALQVGGGAGLGGSLFVANTATFGSTTPGIGSSSSIALQTLQIKGGGLGIVGDTYLNGNINISGQQFINNAAPASSTQSGALTILGGAGIGQNLYVGNLIFSQGAGVITTATLGNYGVAAIFAGTDTAVSASTGSVTIWNTSNLQTITSRGNTTNQTISITNSNASINTNSGALVVSGGVGLWTNLNVGSEIRTSANLYVATTASFNSTLDASTINTASVTIAGGLAVAKTIYALSEVITGSGNSTSVTATNALAVTNGGLGVAGSALIGGAAVINSGANAISTNSGQALLVAGGVGVGAQLAAGKVLTTDATAAATNGTGSLQVGGGGYFANNIVVMGTAASTGTTSSNALYVAGGVGIAKSLLVGGDTTFSGSVTFNGTATYVYSTNTYYTDNIIELHTPPGGVYSQWTVDDGKDIGLRFHYYNRTLSTDSNAALVLADDSQVLEWYGTGAEANTGTFSSATYGTFRTGSIQLTTATNASSAITGALQIQSGGIGVNGNLWLGGNSRTASSSTVLNQTVIVNANGLGVTGDSYFASNVGIGNSLNITNGATVGTRLLISGGTASTSSVSAQGLNVTSGGIGVGGDSIFNNNLSVGGQLQITNTLNSNQFGTAALVVSGGQFIVQDLRVAGTIFGTLWGTATTATNITGGAQGSIPYQTSNGKTAFIDIGLNNYLLQSNGTTATWQNPTTLVIGTAAQAGLVSVTGTNANSVFYPTMGAAVYPSTVYEQLYSTSSFSINGNTGVTTFSGTVDSTTSTNGTVITSGGLGVAKSAFIGGNITNYGFHAILGNTNSTTTQTGALTVVGGAGIGANLNVGGSGSFIGSYTETSTTLSVVVGVGGAGTATPRVGFFNGTASQNWQIDNSNGNFRWYTPLVTRMQLDASGNLTVFTGTNATSTLTGALQVAGGVGIGGAIFAGGTITAATGTAGTSVIGFVTNNATIATYTGTPLNAASTSSAINLDVWSTSSYRSARYTIQLVDTGFTPNRIHFTEMVIIHDGSANVYKSEYGVITSVGELGTFDATVTGSGIQLTFQPTWPSLTPPSALVIKAQRTTVTL